MASEGEVWQRVGVIGFVISSANTASQCTTMQETISIRRLSVRKSTKWPPIEPVIDSATTPMFVRLLMFLPYSDPHQDKS